MKHREIQSRVVQGLSRQLWKWSVTIEDVTLKGQAATESEAIAEAERAIDRALLPRKDLCHLIEINSAAGMPPASRQPPLGGVLLQRPFTRIAPIKLNNGV